MILTEEIGKKYNYLTVVSFDGVNKYNRPVCIAKCDCGNLKKTLLYYLRQGETKSCGCRQKLHSARKIHGFSRKNNTEYEIWKGMKARCYNKNHDCYDRYGGSGVVVCERWRNSFLDFLSDMGQRPSKRHSLDRFPNQKGNYEPDNVRWGTIEQQARNKSTTRNYTAFGVTMCLSDWATKFQIGQSSLHEYLGKHTFLEAYNRHLAKFSNNS